ncbi:hypothetical protein SNOG_00514 [Parastagonospora nodorum SN15]|uniref:Uncharacterized protein n=1 Tax=Phaeosphaeria nodorum (strain SN15 / ATCC MYA-4574 / FGSC 10173) TaxID=321614 RepID=Q0V650_PHANO|nr:hypothetical protein SNOG_00514 [Parastagonospora nodorum SN15]EAT92009.2 hypothetical protein SNOG_00514 [Parastagonospora nodorum SN15]
MENERGELVDRECTSQVGHRTHHQVQGPCFRPDQCWQG